MTERETAADIIARIREKVAENPTHVYEKVVNDEGFAACVYFTAGGPPESPWCPSCLVGWGIAPILDDDDFGSEGFVCEGDVASTLMSNLLGMGTISAADPQEISWINRVQAAQDAGAPWGHAVAVADEDYPLDGIR